MQDAAAEAGLTVDRRDRNTRRVRWEELEEELSYAPGQLDRSRVRYAIGHDDELAPFAEQVEQRFRGWLDAQEIAGREFTGEQRQWLEHIKNYIAGSVSIEPADLQYAPFAQRGGIGRAHALFGDGLAPLLEELNLALAG